MEVDNEPASKRPRLLRENSLDQAMPILGAVSTRTAPGSAELIPLSKWCSGVVADESGVCYVTGFISWKRGGCSRIQRIGPDGEVSVLAGGAEQDGDVDGVGEAARFNRPYGIAISPDGSTLFVTESSRRISKIRQIDVASRTVSTLAGSEPGFEDGVGPAALFSSIGSVVMSPDGSTLFVSDWGNNRIRQINIASRVVSTLACIHAYTGW